jgi:hypothetical protein
MHAQLLLLTRALGGAARKLHQGPSEVLRDGLSQYHMNKSTRGQIMFETTMTSWLDRQRPLVLIPKRVKPVWVSLKREFWQGEFSDEVRKSFGMPAPLPITFLITAASDTLSMPMTILYGLEKLSDDDGWTRKNTSTIHVHNVFSPQMVSPALLNVNRFSVPTSRKSAAALSSKNFCIVPEVKTLNEQVL